MISRYYQDIGKTHITLLYKKNKNIVISKNCLSLQMPKCDNPNCKCVDCKCIEKFGKCECNGDARCETGATDQPK